MSGIDEQKRFFIHCPYCEKQGRTNASWVLRNSKYSRSVDEPFDIGYLDAKSLHRRCALTKQMKAEPFSWAFKYGVFDSSEYYINDENNNYEIVCCNNKDHVFSSGSVFDDIMDIIRRHIKRGAVMWE